MTTANPRNPHEPITSYTHDKLGRQVYVERIVKRLTRDDCPPVIGLYGSWGTGKTSFLNSLKSYYEDYYEKVPDVSREKKVDNKLHIEIIDAWRYEQTGNLLTPVMARLQRTITGSAEEKNFNAAIAKVLTVAGLIVMDATLRAATFDLAKPEDITRHLNEIKAIEQERLKFVDHIDEAIAEFKNAVNAVCSAKRATRLILMIDNLDRCLPDNVVALLESIKNLFSESGGCVWVLAIDPDVVAGYIDQKYGVRIDGHSYLDKIVPEQFHLPMPKLQGETEVGTVANFIRNEVLNEPGQTAGIPYQRGVLMQLPHTLVPRRIIKAAYTYKRLLEQNAAQAQMADREYAFSLILLYHTWPEFYRWLSADSPDYIHGVLQNFLTEADKTNLPLNTPQKSPLPEHFNNQEMKIYVRAAFISRQYDPQNLNAPDRLYRVADDMRLAILWLRQAGLP